MSDAVIYARISQDRTGGGLGVERQEKDCRELARRLGWDITQVYVDNDISAFSGKERPEYQRLTAAMIDGSVTRVLAWHTDRIHRTPRELEDYIDASEKHGAITHTVKAGLVDLSTPGGQAMARTLCAWARYESHVKSDRTKAWARQRAEYGKAPGGIRPFGWNEDRVSLKPSEATVIVELADRLLAGESLRSLVADLNERGIPTVQWHPPLTLARWSTTVVRSMMLRPRLAGWRTHNGEIVTKGEWEPILDEATWQQVRTLLSDPARRSGGAGGRVNLLTGLAVCHHCDRPVTIQYGGAKRPVNSRNAYGCRDCGVWRAQPVVDAYVEAAAIAALEDMTEENDPGLDELVVARIARLRARIVQADEAFADDDDITPEQHRRIVRRLRANLAVEEAKLKPARSRVLTGVWGEGAAERWGALPLDRKRAVIGALMEVRILKAGSGRRAFRPETVQINLR
jgi:DNA invertase Pin-like site-specific DNA recombinase